MGKYDIPANITKIKELTGFQKILYLGYSQGTTQMFYGLSKYEESFYADNLLKFAAFAPCTLLGVKDRKEWEHSIFQYDDQFIFFEGGDEQYHNAGKICGDMDNTNCYYANLWLTLQPTSLQSSLHYAQCSIEGRFQEFSTDYLDEGG